METVVSNKLESRITLDKATLNTSVQSKLFEVPESRLKK